MQSLAEGRKQWGIPVACLHEFLSIATNPKIFSPASTDEQTLSQVEAWLALHSRRAAQQQRALAGLARKGRLQGDQFHDARIAALCLENGASVLWSTSRDFG